MKNLILYNYFRSSTSYRARIALELKKLNYEYYPIHLINNGGEQHSEDYRKLNPMGGIPTLVHDGKVIGQTMAILQYLDDAFPQTQQLFPKDFFEKAKVIQFCENINTDIHPVQNLKVLKYLKKNFSTTEEQNEHWVQHWITEGFHAVEKMAGETSKDYCFGSSVTAADIFLIPQMVTAQRFHTDLSPFPTLNKIYKNCLELEAFKKAHPFRQVDTPEDMRIS
ncbi:MAG: maleylacetoacetate isomerase [Bdellovibrio sp.]|nr:maleylacetoacetate isomerase [Bdellovibrio sp.]